MFRHRKPPFRHRANHCHNSHKATLFEVGFLYRFDGETGISVRIFYTSVTSASARLRRCWVVCSGMELACFSHVAPDGRDIVAPKALCSLILVAAFFGTNNAYAVPVLSLEPANQTGDVNDPYSFDVVISDLPVGEVVSAYDIDVTYDSSVLAASSVFQPFSSLGGAGDAFYNATFPANMIHIDGLSLLSDAQLLALQGGDSVIMATLFFTGIAVGFSSLDFTSVRTRLPQLDLDFD